MTTLTTLIDRVHTAQKERDECDYDTDGAFEDTLEQARHALLQFVLFHADAIAERERLERAVVSAWEHLKLGDIHPKEFDMEVEKLTEHLIAHADDGAAT